jgi:hypothetical protein
MVVDDRADAGGKGRVVLADDGARSRLCITGSTSTQVGQSRLATMTRPLVGRLSSMRQFPL